MAELGKIDWIGVEQDEVNTSYVDSETEKYSRNQDIINMDYSSLIGSGWDVNRTDQLLFLLHASYIIALATHPEVFSGVKVYPLEDRNLKTEADDLVRDIDFWMLERVGRDVYNITETQYLEIKSFLTAMLDESRLIPESELLDFLDRLGVPEEPRMTRMNIRMVRTLAIDMILLSKRRDTAIVQSILELPGNGLLLFGTAHGPGIKQGLIEACQKER